MNTTGPNLLDPGRLTGGSAGMDDVYLNARAAARYLGVSPTTLYKLIKAGTLTTFRSAVNKRDRLLRRADLDRLKLPQPGGERR